MYILLSLLLIRLLVVLCYGRGGVVLADEQVSVFSGISTAAVSCIMSLSFEEVTTVIHYGCRSQLYP